jgi:hypothetical protein
VIQRVECGDGRRRDASALQEGAIVVNYVKRIVCLANSRKHSGRCIAGKEASGGVYDGWIRPVSARPSAEISEEERRFEGGEDPRVLDIVDVPMLAPAPWLYQTENHILDAEFYWTRIGKLPWTELRQLVDEPEILWSNGDSTYYGRNDRIKLDVAGKMINSLVLIRPQDLSIVVREEGAPFGNPRRRVRADFKYRGVNYLMVVTDPVAERAFLAETNGQYRMDEAYLSVSLGEPHTDNCCYKLVAAVIAEQLLRGNR